MRVVDLIYQVEDVADNNGIIIYTTEYEEDAEKFVIDKQLQKILYNADKKTFDFIKYLMDIVEESDIRDYFLETEIYQIIGREKNGGI